MPSTLNLVFSKYSSRIHSINHPPLGKSDHATLQVNFAVSDLPAGNISKPKWCYDNANVQGLLCAANGIDWASISQMAHENDQWYHITKSILLLQDRLSLPVLCHDEGPFPGSERNTNVHKQGNIWRSSSTRAAHRLIHSRCTAKNQISCRN